MARVSTPILEETIPLAEWAHLHCYLIWIYDGEVDASWRKGTITAPHLTAWLIREGQVTVTVGKRQFKARAGEWLFPPPGEVSRQFSDDARILSVRFRASWPSGEELFNEGLGLCLDAGKYPELEKAARPLATFVRRHFPRSQTYLLNAPATLAVHLRLQCLFANWLDASVQALTRAGIVPSHMGHIDVRLLRAVRSVEGHNLARPFLEHQLAGLVGLSVSQLNRLFVRQFGISSFGFMERRRKEFAGAALQSSDRSIKEIAFELGFSSLPHFSAWAKRQLGHSPRNFRLKSTGRTHLGRTKY